VFEVKRTEKMLKIVILLIKFYQNFISPMRPARCRFNPTCSEYCKQSIEKHGL